MSQRQLTTKTSGKTGGKKPAGKAAGRKGSAPVSSDAGAVLDLQQTAGNKAVVQLLAIQRKTLDDALNEQASQGGGTLDIDDIARSLLGNGGGGRAETSSTSESGSTADSGSTAGTGAKTDKKDEAKIVKPTYGQTPEQKREAAKKEIDARRMKRDLAAASKKDPKDRSEKEKALLESKDGQGMLADMQLAKDKADEDAKDAEEKKATDAAKKPAEDAAKRQKRKEDFVKKQQGRRLEAIARKDPKRRTPEETAELNTDDGQDAMMKVAEDQGAEEDKDKSARASAARNFSNFKMTW